MRSSRSLLVAGLVLLAGCPALPPTSGERESVQVQSWTPVSQPAQAPWAGPRTLLYTYVLSGDAADQVGAASANPQRVQARRALEQLLLEIQAFQRASSIEEAGLLKRANQFVIPARERGGTGIGLAQYDFALSARYLDRFRLVLADDPALPRRLDQFGPFLIATKAPLDEIAADVSNPAQPAGKAQLVMLVDLSGAHEKAMPAYVKAFKEAVRTSLPTQFGTFTSWRADFASGLLKMSEAMPFVAEAYAGTSKLLAPGASK